MCRLREAGSCEALAVSVMCLQEAQAIRRAMGLADALHDAAEAMDGRIARRRTAGEA